MNKITYKFKKLKNLNRDEITQLKRLTLKGPSMMRLIMLSCEDPADLKQESIYLLKDQGKVIAWFYYAKDELEIPGLDVFAMIYVKTTYRKKGLATKLFLKGLKQVKKISKTVCVYPHDKKSQEFYAQKKFKEFCKNNNIKMAMVHT